LTGEGDQLPRRTAPNNVGDRSPSSTAIAVVFAALAVVCVVGYFFLMKLVSISRDEDCALAHRYNCAAIEVPSNQ
jgi:hypothetical protein